MEKIFNFLDKQNILKCRLVSQTWKNHLDSPLFWFKKLTVDKTLVGPRTKRDQKWKDVENEWKYLAEAAEKVDGMNQYFVLPLMKFYQKSPCQHFWGSSNRNHLGPCKPLEVVENIWRNQEILTNTWKQFIHGNINRQVVKQLMTKKNDKLEKFPILVDFILTNVKANSEICYYNLCPENIYLPEGNQIHGFDNSICITPIHLAAMTGKVEVVKKLIPKYQELNFPKGECYKCSKISTMLLACKFGSLEVVKILAAHIENPNAKCRSWFDDWTFFTPIHYAGMFYEKIY